MANIKSQKKRIVTAEKARMRNKAVRSELKTAVKRVRAAVEANDAELAQAEANKAGKLLDKAASKGIIHKNQAAQRKSGRPQTDEALHGTTLAAMFVQALSKTPSERHWAMPWQARSAQRRPPSPDCP